MKRFALNTLSKSMHHQILLFPLVSADEQIQRSRDIHPDPRQQQGGGHQI